MKLLQLLYLIATEVQRNTGDLIDDLFDFD